jgi:prepilin-type N-terminal cleavage/methylation domain-containing protein
MRRDGMRGVTLLELLFVIGIMAVLLGFTSQGMDLVRRERVVSATQELYADIQKARVDSMTGDGKGFGIRLVSHNAYIIFKFNDCNNDSNYDSDTCANGTREETDIVKRELHSSVMLCKTNPSTSVNNDVRIFDRFGVPRRSSGGIGPITIFVKNDQGIGPTRCVTISINRIREGTWSGSECI